MEAVFLRIGLDVGSTTIKAVVLDDCGNICYTRYERHMSQVSSAACRLLGEIAAQFPGAEQARLAVSGSAGMGMAEACGLTFVQEVYATRVCAQRLEPGADVVIELGGEDAKILFLKGIPDARMNGTCAGGTGAFIDQMAALLGVEAAALDALAEKSEKCYTIASRCGVFAKSDIQPLINQGARAEDIAESILKSVVNQTVTGLAQGRPIEGRVLYLGGPLTFLPQLRRAFDQTLDLVGVCPDNSLYFVALGAAYSADACQDIRQVIAQIAQHGVSDTFAHAAPLFETPAQYAEFQARHARDKAPRAAWPADDRVFVGVDAGSTTVKFAVIDAQGRMVDSLYRANSGNPIPLVREFLQHLYEAHPGLVILASAVTGYGEDLIRSAFQMDYGVVETMAHMISAKRVVPEVDFILDIGGQDMKCLKLRNGVIDNMHLNEACSSGCGSFLQTFAGALGMSVEAFAHLGILADRPVDLGSRCTVFMNSSVKQAQKDGASTANISAGLSMSIVKNALYKVIRPSSADALGQHIVVQGGTFLNDAVLRAFEMELGKQVTRPDIAALSGAYGAALYARDRRSAQPGESSTLGKGALRDFVHEVRAAVCGKCENHCRLTVNLFEGGRKHLSGNRCERPVTGHSADESLNLYARKLAMIREFVRLPGARGRVGIPLGLNLYELLPFWHAFFGELGCEVVVSPVSDRALYMKGQGTIPSDTVCFPAKLMHGHVAWLIEHGVTTIFYPAMTYNLDEGLGDNHYNCPVVAYYPEVLAANMRGLQKVDFIHGYVGLHNKKALPGKLYQMLSGHPLFAGVTRGQVKAAIDAGFLAYEAYMARVYREGARIIMAARAQKKPIVVLAGRPYHIDPEINHGIDQLISGMGMAVISEDAVSTMSKERPKVAVLNQWTYHSRLYAAAEYVKTQPDMEFVQLVSFGCGCDAITADECRRILEGANRIYTQIKIDEIENLGAAKIRLRSLFAATGREK